MSLNNGILFNGVFKPKLCNNPFASCSFINLDFLLSRIAHFDDNINQSFLVSNIFESIFFVSFFCTLNNMSTCFIMTRINITNQFFIVFLFFI